MTATPRATLEVAIHAPLGAGFVLDISRVFGPGVTVLFGASGSGKTTLLNCIAGLVRPANGRIAIGPRVLFDSSSRVSLAPQQRRMGYVFQHLALFPHLSVTENVEYGLSSLARDQRRERSERVMQSFHIAHLHARKPQEISGGERQRVALARTLVMDPEALLLDEPLAALDVPTRALLLEDLRRWSSARPMPVLYVTHSRDEVFALAQRVIVLEHGKVIADGTPQQVLDSPTHEWTALAAGFENLYDAEVLALHEQEGTMTCRLGASQVTIEAPLARARIGETLRIGVRAGDVLLATQRPHGLSARNVLPARIVDVQERGAMASIRVDCGIAVEAHVTRAACRSLEMGPGRELWIVLKTHSCHLFRPE